ncbi:phosphoethanolamine transferase [Pseudomonas xantholysinigenes]|uniref:Phosphoethanolamine--lipid A transferase n=1 Tax=Pseudomonas xantholysinigenes TaxID=2745490 RepID=A0A9E6PTI7_9PSED|nr:phosphoethanolamine--lipid A transferase [Pseudomonas xantholysinigenes]QXI36410.1 phosphoethanolamine--lipid A transferase [Pseudomonas xantholysinigenes]
MSEGKRNLFPEVSTARLVLLFALALVLFYNFSTWRALNGLVPMEGPWGMAFFGSFALFLWAAFTLLLTLVSFRPLLKPALTLVALVSAAAAYFMNTYGVVIDTVMVQNIIETNPMEAAALFSARLVGYLLVLGVLPAAIIWLTPVRYSPFLRGLLNKVLVIAGCLLVVAVCVGAFYSTYAPVFRQEEKVTHFINPTNYIYAVSKFTKQRLGIKENLVVQPIGEDALMPRKVNADGKKSLMILVVGETARADHFALNGYARDTNPELSKLDILNFANVSSCGTSTAVSVPCMFSKFPREDYSDKKGKTYQSLLDILQRVGVSVLWLDNNSDCKGTCLRVPNRDIPKDQPGPFCDGENCLDEALLQDLQAYIDKQQDNALIVLHADGSHGPEYYDRYPKSMERFTPVCHTNQLGSCSNEELVNVYDNTILYTDFFLSKVVALLKHNEARFDTTMLYVSDHGESLGENGVYLHAAPYAIAPKAQTHVPMVMWFGNGALDGMGVDRGCLAQQAGTAELSHDNLFHSVLGLYGVHTSLYQPALDIFHGCKRKMTVAQ